MEQLCVLLILVLSKAADASVLIYPGQLDHAEGDACTTPSGGTGTCSRSCAHSSSFGESARCGIKDSAFLVCCDKTLNVPFENLDVSSPLVSFDCSASKPQVIQTHVANDFSSRETWPWMALLGRKGSEGLTWHCTGMLINEQWVLTDAICLFDEQTTVVRLAEYDYNDDSDGANHQDFSVVETVVYPDYSPPLGYHSLMLLKLDSRVNFQKYISPVCLPWGDESKNDITGQKAFLLTYGNKPGVTTTNSVQKEIDVTVFPVAQCDRSYSTLSQYSVNWPRGMGQESLCAGDPAGEKDACQGDSGGPLMTLDASGHYVVAGIVSYGHRSCGHKDYPGVYVNLRYSPYLAWIKKVAFTTI